MGRVSGLLGIIGVLTVCATAAAAVPVVRGIAIEERLDAPSVLLPALPAGASPLVPVVVNLVIDVQQFREADSSAALSRLDARLALYRARNIPVVLVLGALPASDAELTAWMPVVRGIAEHERGKVSAYQIGAATGTLPVPRTYAFALKQTAVQLRSIDGDVVIAQGPIASAAAAWERDVYIEGVAPYIDAVAVDRSEGDSLVSRAAATAVADLVGREDPTAATWLGPIDLPDESAQAAERLFTATLGSTATRVGVTIFRGREAAVRAGLTSAARLGDFWSGELVLLDQNVRWFRSGVEITRQVSSKLVYSPSTTDTYVIVEGGLPPGGAELEVNVTSSAPVLRDALAGSIEKLSVPAPATGKTTRLTVRAPTHPFVVDLNYGIAAPAATSEVRGSSLPSVEELIARQQQVQATQDAVLQTYIAHLRIEQHFRPTPADPAYNIVTENRLFADASGKDKEWEELSFSLNGATWTSNRPSFPLLQPEKVLSLPLDLRLTQDYRYRLNGIESIDGRPAFVVRFDPIDPARALYRGTLWIDCETYARLKLSAIQTPGVGPVSTNEEEQYYTDVGEIGGKPIRLLTRLTGRQTLLVAGRTILNERELHLTDVQLNPPEFAGRRAEARGGAQLMYKDTDAGVRYFVKKGTTRVVSESVTASAKAFAMGADIDPSFDFPLPIAGINILDFNFLHRDMQLALLFGGVIALGNIQRAGLWNGRVDVSVDFFGLAVKSNDSVFDGSGERRGERLRNTPASTGFNLGYRISPSHKVTTRFEARYDKYFRDTETAAEFTAPSSTGTIGQGIGYEYRHHGYSLLANAAAYRRTNWTAWGNGLIFDPSTSTYTKYDVGVSKDFVFKTFNTIHVNGQLFGGQRLDRFSMYQFGLFDATRMHGVPSAVRFSQLAMLRGSYSFNLLNQYRFDLFVDHAIGRDLRLDHAWRPVTGFGLGVNLRGPHSTILRGDLGRSMLPDVYKGAGSTVVQLMVLKPL